MQWAANRPTEPGLYGARHNNEDTDPEVVQIQASPSGFYVSLSGPELDELIEGGYYFQHEWLGPLDFTKGRFLTNEECAACLKALDMLGVKIADDVIRQEWSNEMRGAYERAVRILK